jgi:putative GTP pyrophosphokinase
VTSRTQIDKLGERLKAGPTTEADLRLLDEYRLTFAGAYQAVIDQIVALGLGPTGRPAKSTKAIIEKLRRESIRLTQIQDIAGCRVIVETMTEQDSAVAALRLATPVSTVLDRRVRPSYGYRAVHVVAEVAGHPVEVQVRTRRQHVWAELSEKVADSFDPAIKYGGGPLAVRAALETFSDVIYRVDCAGGVWTVETLEALGRSLLAFAKVVESLERPPRTED